MSKIFILFSLASGSAYVDSVRHQQVFDPPATHKTLASMEPCDRPSELSTQQKPSRWVLVKNKSQEDPESMQAPCNLASRGETTKSTPRNIFSQL